MLGRCEDKGDLIVAGHTILLPPVQLNDILTAAPLHPVKEAQRHKPPQLIPKALIESNDGAVVQVVIVVVTDEDSVDLGELGYRARRRPEPLRTQVLRRRGPGAEDGIREEDELIHLHHQRGMAQPRDSQACLPHAGFSRVIDKIRFKHWEFFVKFLSV